MKQQSWVGFDLDGVLAHYVSGQASHFQIGDPIPENIERCRAVMRLGYEVRIFTARVDGGLVYQRLDPTVDNRTVEVYRQVKMIETMIQEWTIKHLGESLAVTCIKDAAMIALYDDRVIQIEKNTGNVLGLDFLLTPKREIGFIEELKLKNTMIDHLRKQVDLHREKARDNYWAWDSRENNHLESLVDSAAILISAGDLRGLLERRL